MKNVKKVILGLGILLSLVQNIEAADFTPATAKYKIDNTVSDCKRIGEDEVNTILYEVNQVHTRGYLKSINYYDSNRTMNFLFMFSDGIAPNGLPKFLFTFTTYDGCKMFYNNPAPFMQYLR